MPNTLSFEQLQALTKDDKDGAYAYQCGRKKEIGEGIEKNLHDAIIFYTKAACKGNANAQFALGVIAVAKNSLQEAMHWWEMAAKQGHETAQYNLIICYLEGRGVERSIDYAIKLMTASTQTGNSKAEYLLAREYYNGKNLPRSFEYAASHFLNAAKRGVTNAMNDLSMMYSMGQVGGKSNPVIAYGLAKSAFDHGYKGAERTIRAIENTYTLTTKEKAHGVELSKSMLKLNTH
ncbi:tetratricopeptide repeat protein [Kistimonas asteriae]|uniref:tetratricopeptide repeat protein n=1 Tax=Kistimonas asteriae TaxID=517724 RepID=UPI001BACE35D|nr:SEL1-like repeat protein [Kistimonas asteriae]